eukprot:TRINITY_DN1216_c0_g1_i1.p1 TRINITY_DN1216_c0_g1~~TRINITY_DN1216_c0_g1_i1.p1  ORF type:complete len:3093 (+),score=684.35 TRINITY_DN1216_c0_g1_i1:77-9355(+)
MKRRNSSMTELDQLFPPTAPVQIDQLPNSEEMSPSQLINFSVTLGNRHRIDTKQGRPLLLKRLHENATILELAYKMVADAAHGNTRLSHAEEWFIDNFYLLSENINNARKFFPPGYDKKMPRLLNTDSSGLPRVYGLMLELISLVNCHITEANVNYFVQGYQSVSPLRIGELWAIPIMLRLGLLENIRSVADKIINMRKDRNVANVWADKLLDAAEKSGKSVIEVLFQMSQSQLRISDAFVIQISQRLQGSDPLLSVITTWLEQQLSTQGLDIDDVHRSERHANQLHLVRLRNSITSLRFVNTHQWTDFVESQSLTESILRKDPMGIYTLQDFSTRDACRHAIEGIAEDSKKPEQDIANFALELSSNCSKEYRKVIKERSTKDPAVMLLHRKGFIGYWLIDPDGQIELRRQKGLPIPLLVQLTRVINTEVRIALFALSVATISILFTLSALGLTMTPAGEEISFGLLSAHFGANNWISFYIYVFCLLVVGSQLGVAMTNQFCIHTASPTFMPRLDFLETGLPDEHRTIVVVPTMLTNVNSGKELAADLRARFLVNRDPNIYFAILTDFPDAKTETCPTDDAILQAAVDAIDELNTIYPNDGGSPFFMLFHRPRKYNAVDKIWMGYERKRGKLSDFNHLMRGGAKGCFSKIIADQNLLKSIQYVITLDTDTMLPSDSAKKMIGTMAHVLNKPVYDPTTRQVVCGYTLLQPRVSYSISNIYKSLYGYWNSLDSGVDPYTRQVSDVYQDVFGEGSFIGKGIYHLDVFESVFDNRFPDNRILSHDLIEGCYCRSGFASDVEVIEEYPPSYLTEVSRRHRWVRGDWQIAAWLLPFVPSPSGYTRNTLSSLSKWKVFDNLRRSLVPTGMLGMLLYTWCHSSFSSGTPLIMTVFSLSAYVIPGIVDISYELVHKPEDADISLHLGNVLTSIYRRLIPLTLDLIFLPIEAFNNLDAALRCLARLFFTRKGLLEWTTSTAAAALFSGNTILRFVRILWFGPFTAIVTIGILFGQMIVYGVTFSSLISSAEVTLFSANFLLVTILLTAWATSPFIAWWVSSPMDTPESGISKDDTVENLTDDQREFLHVLSRRTWRFFEAFITADDHWLPIDNFQEFPKPMFARRTSPTNIGLALLANIGAWDFGFISMKRVVERTQQTLTSMNKLERYRGHFYNWYDTSNMQPLYPKYISSVDSGNLFFMLVLLSTCVKELLTSRIIPAQLSAGILRGNLLVLDHLNRQLQKKSKAPPAPEKPTDDCAVDETPAPPREFDSASATTVLKSLKDGVEKIAQLNLVALFDHLSELKEPCKQLIDSLDQFTKLQAAKSEKQKEEIISSDGIVVVQQSTETKEGEMLYYARALLSQFEDAEAEIKEFFPWIPILSSALKTNQSVSLPESLIKKLVNPELTLSELNSVTEEALSSLTSGESSETSASRGSIATALQDAFAKSKTSASKRIADIKEMIEMLAVFSDQDYSFLYNNSRNLLSIGFNVDRNQMDNSFYDMFCSEARLCSYVCVAKGLLPVKHWFSMGRLLTGNKNKAALLSWSGSMFEYLMPLLVIPSIPGTLLDQTYKAVVRRQIEYGQQKKVPWGVSESAYNMMDAGLVYQYGPFGVPGLGLKRGLSNELVIAPYASCMATMVAPVESCKNLMRLTSIGMQGTYGMYESIDFTQKRLRGAITAQPIQSFFVHHEGMSFLALLYTLLDKPLQRRFYNTPEFAANDLLLQEKIPKIPYIINPNKKELTRWKNPEGNFPSSNRRYQGLQVYSAPDIHILSNGKLHVMVTVHGSGYINYKETSICRWREDITLDNYGMFFYIRDLDNKRFWTATSTPVLAPHNSNYSVLFSQGKAEFTRVEEDIESKTTIVVSLYDSLEVRRVELKNNSSKARTLDLTSYSEIVLGSARGDASHRAFANLFIQTEILSDHRAILAFRKPRTHKEKTMYAFHSCFVHCKKRSPQEDPSFETDRNEFVGRGYSMQAPRGMCADITSLRNPADVHYPLDPVFAIRQKVVIPANSSIMVDFITGVAETKDEAIKLLQKSQRKTYTNSVMDYSWINSQKLNFRLGISEIEAQLFCQLAGCILYSNSRYRASPRLIAKNRSNQSGLWRLGISGDLCIILVRIGDVANMDLITQCLQAHTYLRSNGILCDLVIWNDETSTYRDELQTALLSLIANMPELSHMLQRPGGVFPVRGENISEHESILLYSTARIVISDYGGRLVDQIHREPRKERELPPLLRLSHPSGDHSKSTTLPLPKAPISSENERKDSSLLGGIAPLEQRELVEVNEYGGFDQRRKEFVMMLEEGKSTPAPWSNVLANETFGTVVSERGSGYTWFENAHEFRLTPWANDVVTDVSGEAFYIRDDQTGQFWSPQLQPMQGKTPYAVRHGYGYSVWEHSEFGIRSDMVTFVPPNESVKIFLVQIKNHSGRHRKLTVAGFVEWVLGELRDRTSSHIITDAEYGTYTKSIMARNPYHLDFGMHVGFFGVIGHDCSMTADRSEFIGYNRTPSCPAAMERIRLSGTVGSALDPCAAIMVPIELKPESSMEVAFVLGATHSSNSAKDLCERIRSNLIVHQLLKNTKAFWLDVLQSVTIETPDTSVNLLTNGWLLYQVLSSRVFGRSGFYQSSGAFGFRDQLQDTMSLAHAAPHLLRRQILSCCEHQFEKGDVLHWWHQQGNRGTRTRISDDYLFLPLAVYTYLENTNDAQFLDASATYCTGVDEPAEGHESVFNQARGSDVSASVYDHCKAAIRYGLKFGEHGLPLMGCGDWNDGMNEVGIHGKGESVWLGFFLYHVLEKFSFVARKFKGDTEFSDMCQEQMQKLKENLDKHAWDGEWYLRAFFDDGQPLGSHTNDECQIDCLSQSWATISGAVDAERAKQALASANQRLVRRDHKLIQLFDPPFEKTALEPGYIKGYAKGVRENGGQYTHAAVWLVWAYAEARDAKAAWELLDLINPVRHTRTHEDLMQYKGEPYAMAADVYMLPGHEGRAGWTLYTGSAGWMYRCILQRLIGVEQQGSTLVLSPLPRPEWNEFKVHYRHKRTMYHLQFLRRKLGSFSGYSMKEIERSLVQQQQQQSQERKMTIVIDDMETVDDNRFELIDDGREHHVKVLFS